MKNLQISALLIVLFLSISSIKSIIHENNILNTKIIKGSMYYKIQYINDGMADVFVNNVCVPQLYVDTEIQSYLKNNVPYVLTFHNALGEIIAIVEISEGYAEEIRNYAQMSLDNTIRKNIYHIKIIRDYAQNRLDLQARKTVYNAKIGYSKEYDSTIFFYDRDGNEIFRDKYPRDNSIKKLIEKYKLVFKFSKNLKGRCFKQDHIVDNYSNEVPNLCTIL